MTAPAGREASEARRAAARLALNCFLADPVHTGVHLRARHGPAREAWLQAARIWCGTAGVAIVRVPAAVPDGALLGTIDLAASLSLARPVIGPGLLARADGDILLVASAERLSPSSAALIAAAAERRHVDVERDGLSQRLPSSFGLIVLDEGDGEDEGCPAQLAAQCAIRLELDDGLRDADFGDLTTPLAEEGAGRPVKADDSHVRRLCGIADSLGVTDMRRCLQALSIARISARIGRREAIDDADLAVAVTLVIAPRATRMPDTGSPPSEVEGKGEGDTAAGANPAESDGGRNSSRPGPDAGETVAADHEAMPDMLVAAALAVLPEHLPDAEPTVGEGGGRRSATARRAAGKGGIPRHGRPLASRPGTPDRGRLDILATLRAAAPWQRIRRGATNAAPSGRLSIRPGDLRIRRFRPASRVTSIFVVDASGSAALDRLGEAKGAVERLLARAYRNRDRVALIAFRGDHAELLMAPTRSPASARRKLAALPAGGATPLAAALREALRLAARIEKEEETPAIVVLTDGRANIALDGTASRPDAVSDAEKMARLIRAVGYQAAVIDISARPRPQGEALAAAMGARYFPLPGARSDTISKAVATLPPGPRR